VDAFSSCLVLWRFWGHHGDEERLALREKRASTMVALALFISAAVVFATAVSNLAKHEIVTDVGLLLALTVPSVILLAVLGGFKLHVARRLGSSAMKKDAVCSFASSVLSLGIVISIAVQAADPDIWWIDATLAVVVSVSAFLSACLPTCLSVLFVCLFVCLLACMSVCLPACLLACVPVCLVYLFVCLSSFLSVTLW
jgi:ABC-type transport system involved in cytochrome bd biosynthesis fused ATPase/permease subunit